VLSELQYPPTCRIPAACWRAYACRVVSRANIKPPEVGRCSAIRPSRKSRSNSVSLRANYRGAGAPSQSDRIQSIATNGRSIPHPQPALPRVGQSARTHNPFLKRGSFKLSQIADEATYRTVGRRTSRHENTNEPGIPCVKLKIAWNNMTSKRTRGSWCPITNSASRSREQICPTIIQSNKIEKRQRHEPATP
jgi:hypothetical protein